MACGGRRVATLLAVACVLGVATEAGQSPPEIPPDMLITLERDICFGECPVYSVSIDALGRIEYEGREFVRVKGRQTDRVPRGAVAELLDTIAKIRFFDLENAYEFRVLPGGIEVHTTDLPGSYVSVRINGRSKRIHDYDGTPEPLKAFEARIDVLTRTKRWTFLDEPMLASLREGGWTLSNEELAVLLNRGVGADDLPIVQGLLDFGADPNRPPEHLLPPIWSVRSAAVLRALLAAGGNPSATHEGRSLLSAVAYLEPEVTALLLRSGLRPDDDALLFSVRLSNAQVVAMLLAAGANPAARESDGRSALQLARAMRESQKDELSSRLPYRQNPSEVVTLIEQALATR